MTAQHNSPQGSGKSSDDEPKGRRKPNKRRVTSRELGDHIDNELMWWDATAARCTTLRKYLEEQRQHITTLDSLDTELSEIVVKLSTDHLSKGKRLQLGRELGALEERRSMTTAKLRQATKSAGSEGVAMEQDLEQWRVMEKKVTNRIEMSR